MEDEVVRGPSVGRGWRENQALPEQCTLRSLCPLQTRFEFEFGLFCSCDCTSFEDLFWLYSHVSVKSTYLLCGQHRSHTILKIFPGHVDREMSVKTRTP